MKLRQKLAMVLASAMIVTAVPVTTMAASTNTLSSTMIMVEGTKVGYETPAGAPTGSTNYKVIGHHPELQMKIADDVKIEASQGTTFYVKAKDAKFIKQAFEAANRGTMITVDADGYINGSTSDKVPANPTFSLNLMTTTGAVRTGITATAKWLSEDEIEVNVKGTGAAANSTLVLAKGETLNIPLYMDAKKGTPGVEVFSPTSVFSGSGAMLLTSQTVGDKTLTAKVGDTPKITIDGGKLATITLTENIVGALDNKAGAGTDNANIEARTVKVKLPNSSELVFDSGSEIKLTGKYGFATRTLIFTKDGVYNVDAQGKKTGSALDTTVATGAQSLVGCKVTFDENELEIVLPAWAYAGNTFGAIEITGVEVEPEDRNGAKIADVKATISGDMFAEVTETVATVKEFDVEVKCDPVAIVGGKDAKKVTVNVNELVADVINPKDEIVFTLKDGWVRELTKVGTDAYTIAGVTGTVKVGTTTITPAVGHTQPVFTLDQVQKYLEQEKMIEMPSKLSVAKLVLEQVDKDEYHVVGFEAKTVDAKYKKDEANALEVKFEVQAALAAKDSEVTLKVENRGIEDQEVKVATVTQPATVTAEGLTLKTGLKKQVGGKVVLKETAKEMFERKGEIVLSMADDGIEITDAKITVNGVRIQPKTEQYGTSISFQIGRASDEAAEIVIEDIVFNTDRTVPEGGYDLVVSGSALKGSDVCGSIKVEDFITISTKNTEDIQDAATVKEVVLAVGNTTYTVDGKEKTAAVAPFIDAQNRTMVPLRLVSEEFGAKVDFGVLNGVGTITIQKEGTTVQFQNKSKVMNKNGILVPMDTEAVIKEGTTYVPLRYLANALNIDLTWDDATKTITFAN